MVQTPADWGHGGAFVAVNALWEKRLQAFPLVVWKFATGVLWVVFFTGFAGGHLVSFVFVVVAEQGRVLPVISSAHGTHTVPASLCGFIFSLGRLPILRPQKRYNKRNTSMVGAKIQTASENLIWSSLSSPTPC
jgi:hypothetical protein